MNLFRLLGWLIRFTFWFVFRLAGSRLVLAFFLFMAFVLLSLRVPDDLPWAVAIGGIVANQVLRRLARVLRPVNGPRWVRRPPKPAKPLPMPVVALVAQPADAPDERTFTGRLAPELRRLLDPVGQRLQETILPGEPAHPRPMRHREPPMDEDDEEEAATPPEADPEPRLRST